MPSFATLLHSLICPHCNLKSGHEIQFLEGAFPEESAVDVLLGQKIRKKFSKPALKMQKSSSHRTHGQSFCRKCNQNVYSLLTLKNLQIVRLEVFPKTIQRLLEEFPSRLFLNCNHDPDMIFLSDLLAEFPATDIVWAVGKITKKNYSQSFWRERAANTKQFLKKYPLLRDFLTLIESEEPDNEKKSTRAKERRDELTLLNEDEELFRGLEQDPQLYKKEQNNKYARLRHILASQK